MGPTAVKFLVLIQVKSICYASKKQTVQTKNIINNNQYKQRMPITLCAVY